MTFMGFNIFPMPAFLFSASKLLLLEKTIGLCFEILTRDVFLCFAGFFKQDLRYSHRATW